MSPMAKWPDFDSCVSDMVDNGKSEDSAKRICGAIKAKVEGTKLSEDLTPMELSEVKINTSENNMVKYTIDEVQKICPSCYEKMKKIGLLEVILPVSYFSSKSPEETIKNSIEEPKVFAEIRDMEIFRAGIWNGDSYTESDLDKLIENFNKLKEKQSVPLKIGHSEKQEFLKKEGLPAAGWIDKLVKNGKVLVAEVKDVPDKVANLIKKKAYKKVSSEIYPIYKDGDGNKYEKVLRAVALLGGDIPAVDGLKDVEVLYNDENKQEYKVYTSIEENEIKEDKNINLKKKGGEKMFKKLTMSVNSEKFADDFNEKLQSALKSTFGEDTSISFEDSSMDDEKSARIMELEKELDALKKQKKSAEIEDEISGYKQKIAQLEESKKVIECASDKLSKEFSEYKENIRKQEIDAIITNGEKEGRVLPVHREAIRAMLENADRSKLVKFSQDGKAVEKSQWDLATEYVKTLPKIVSFSELGGGAGEGPGGSVKTFETKVTVNGNTYEVTDTELASEVEKYALDNKVTYDEAYLIVSKSKGEKK